MGGQTKAAPDVEKRPEQPSSACLAWNAEAGCSSALETESAIEDVLGRPLFRGVSCDLQINASVRREGPASWQAELTFIQSNGNVLGVRTLQSPSASCKALRNPISLVVALMVEDNDARATLRLAAEATPASASEQLLFTTLSGSHGLLPSNDLGVTMGMDLRAGSWLPSRIDTTLWLPESSAATGPGGHLWAWHAGAAACPSLAGSGGVRASLCLGMQAGVLHGRGVGLDPTWSATRIYGDVQARGMLSFPVWGSMNLTAFVGAAVPWLRPRFVYLDTNGTAVQLHRTSAVVPMAGVGIELPIYPVDSARTETP